MKVLKFGGTSVGSVENMCAVMDIVTDGQSKLVVLSAMSGTTNSLVEIADYLYKKNKESAFSLIGDLEQKYSTVVGELFQDDNRKNEAHLIVEHCFDTIKSFTSGEFTEVAERTILAQGEIISTNLFAYLLQENGHSALLLPALDFMRIDAEKSPDHMAIKAKLKEIIAQHEPVDYYITQGFICKNELGEIDNLQRGGSDYTASLIGAALNAQEIQIWTDIDGFHNNDPRYVEGTTRVDHLSFGEAAELAYFGAKILHPQTVLPAKLSNIPVRLKNTMHPTDPGTLISSATDGSGIKAVAGKDGITALKIRSGRMLNAYGFLKNIFEIFEFFKTPIDMITTSEVAVSVTIDDDRYLNDILRELKEYGDVEVDKDQSIVCVVGDLPTSEKGLARKVFDAVDGIPLRMISYGGSNHNISMLVDSQYKVQALRQLSQNLLNN